MQQTAKKIKLKHHLLSSFGIALLLHVLITVAFLSFNERNPYLTTFDPGRVYPVQLTSDNKASSLNSNQQVNVKKKREVVGSLTGVASNATNDSDPSISADGTGVEVGESGKLIFDSEIESYSPPTYPKVARMRGLEGDVLIRLKVSPEGEALSPEIISSSGHPVLDEAAMNAVKTWRFRARKTSDLAVVEKRIVFRLNQ